jgi:hypothetical protein
MALCVIEVHCHVNLVRHRIRLLRAALTVWMGRRQGRPVSSRLITVVIRMLYLHSTNRSFTSVWAVEKRPTFPHCHHVVDLSVGAIFRPQPNRS